MTVVLPVPAPAMISSGPASWVTASLWAFVRPFRILSVSRETSAIGALATDLCVRRSHQLVQLGWPYECDVAPDRALERGQGRRRVHGLLYGAPLEHPREEARGVGIARAHAPHRARRPTARRLSPGAGVMPERCTSRAPRTSAQSTSSGTS